MDAHLVDRAVILLFLCLAVFVEVETVHRFALQQVEDRDPTVVLDGHEETS